MRKVSGVAHGDHRIVEQHEIALIADDETGAVDISHHVNGIYQEDQ